MTVLVEEGGEYEYKDSGLKIKFTRIDDGVGEITVEEIELTDEQIENLGALSNKAWDITSDMKNGTFEYELTLPTEGDVNEDEIEVVYVEDKDDLDDESKIKTVEKEDVKVDNEKKEIKAEDLDHFTVFIVSATLGTTAINGSVMATVNGQTQVDVDPGAVVTGTLTVQLSGSSPNDWRSTRWKIGNGKWTCVNIPDHKNTGTHTESFDMIAPLTLGEHTVYMRAYSQNGCQSSYQENSSTKVNVKIKDNPVLSATCGLDIALVIDNSNSIDNSELNQMKNALNGFVDALTGTPTQFSVTKFGSSASVVQAFTANADDVKNAINSVSTGGGATNWKDAFEKARGTYDPRTGKPNLMIFASDGNPTYPYGLGNVTDLGDIYDAILEANLTKIDDIRIMALGIGNDLSVDNLKLISGSTVNASELIDSDVVTTDFSQMASDLANFASQTCGGTITVNKYIGSVAPENKAGAGWEFNIAGTAKTTDADGQTDAVEVSAGADYSVMETSVLPGYNFGSASCTGATNNGSQSGNGIIGIQISDTDIVSCNFVNTEDYTPTRICHASDAHANPYVSNTPATAGQLMGHAGHTGPVWYPGIDVKWGDIIPPVPVFLPSGLNWTTEGQSIWDNDCNIPPQTGVIKITKDVVPDDSSTWNFTITGTGGPYNITGLGDGQSQTIDNLQPGSYDITETTNSAYSTQVTCGNTGPLNQNDYLGIVVAGQTLECTFTNTKKSSVTAHKFRDQNMNGTQDGDEVDLSDWNMTLYLGSDCQEGKSRGADITDSNGNVTFYSIIPGDQYSIKETVKDGWDNVTDVCQNFTITPGEDKIIAFGNIENGNVTAIKYNDLDGDGILDGNEPSLGDWDITLGSSGGSETKTTDQNGEAQFPNLAPGDYNLSETIKEGWKQTNIYCTENNENASDIDVSNSHAFSVQAGGNIKCFIGNQQLSDVKVCKEDEDKNRLEGWNLQLLGEKMDEVKVKTDGSIVESIDLPAGDYVLVASGTYEYRGSSGLLTDANFSQRLERDGYTGPYFPWINVNDLNTVGALGIMVNDNPTDWSEYLAADNVYGLPVEGFPGGKMSFDIYDNYYDDNVGDLKVEIYKGHGGTTGEDGCFILKNVILGEYQLNETLKYYWENLSGLGTVAVNDPNEEFVVTNEDHTPYCGDGIKNQESEQCDGDAGVADDGSEFCTSQCKLVPIYDGGHQCPTGTVERLIGGITLDSQSDLSQKLDLLAGNSYLLKASGTYYYSGSDTQRQADPAYGTTNGFSTWREDIGIWGTNRGVTSIIGDLGRGMGVIEWDDDQNIDSDHAYEKLIQPENDLTAEFVISDWYGDWYGPYCGEQGCMGDNSGSLNVDLYQCVDPGSIQGRKYRDVNGNGDFDQNEKTEPNRLDGWEITLYDNQWQAVKSMKTGDDDTEAGDVLKGQYHFVNLVPGTYYVCETGQEGWIQTEPDTSFVKNDLSCHQVVVSAGQSVNEIQFGNYELGIIQGRKYQDDSLDGKHQGPDYEARLDDWGIRLYQEGSEGWVSVGSEAKTGEDISNFRDVEIGQYRFGNLNPGDYYVCEVMKDGWIQTGPIIDSEPVDNNGNPTSSGLAVENLSGAKDEGSICWKTTLDQSGQINDSLKFGNVQKAEISGVKWEDLDGDGQGDEVKNGWEIVMGNLKKIGSYVVDSKSVSVVNTDVLENGKNYLLKVEGTFDAGDSIVADAECSSRNGSPWNTIVKNYESYGNPLLDLELDGSATDWGLCNPNNVYTKNIFGEGSSLSLKINDIYPSNNSGSLNVTLYEFENYQSDTTDNNGEYLFDVYHFGQIGVCETLQKDWIQTYPNSNSGSCYIFDINAGDEIGKLDFANVKLHNIHGFKWNDINGDRMENCGVDDGDQCEEKLAGWEIFLDEDGDQEWDEGEKKTTTSNDPDPKHFGWYWFEDLLPGEYSVCEVLRSEEGWKQTAPGNFEEPQCYTVSLPDSNTAQHEVEENMVDGPVYKFGNQYQPCNLFLSKDTRDWINGPKKVGDKVLYEIVVRAMNNFCKNVKVTDLPPETFSYVDGSWGASSNMRPGFSLGEPTYASPGDWNIGDMQEGEEITLTYQAEIGENTEAGIYPDLAWAQGIDPSGSSLLALAEESEFETDYKGKIDDTFVGTQIEVENPDVAPTVKVRADRDEVIEEEEVEVKVKGASYFPATGANGFWVALALLGILIGGGIASIGYLLKKNKKMDKVIGLFLGLIISGMLVSGALAQTASLISVRLSEPDSHVTGPFNLEFVAMNTTEEEMTVECRKKNSTDSEFVTFDSVDLQAGGDSDVCLVDDSVLTTAGNYDFMVVAKTDSAERSSDTVSVLYDGVGPKTPEYIKKDEETSCRNEVEFKTANDGQTVRVEIYRSQHTRDIVANEDSKIISFDIGPNQKKVFDDDLGPTGCGDNYYYAVRAFDEAGNSSGVRAEEFEVIIEEEKIIEVVEEQSAPTGGIVLAGTVNEEGGEVAGEEAVVEGEAGEENQLEIGEGAQAEDETEVLGEETERGLIGYLKNWRTWLLIGILAAIGWQIYARKVKPKEGN